MHALCAGLQEVNGVLSKHRTLADYKTDLRGLSSDLLAIETSHQTLLLHRLSVGRDNLGNEALVSWKITLTRLMESGKYRQLTHGLACLTSFSPQWCHHRIMLCFTYSSVENASKKVHCHLQQMVLHVGLLACFFFFFFQLMSWHEHFSNRKNRHSGHVLNENFIKNQVQGRKLYTALPRHSCISPVFLSLHVENPSPFFFVLHTFPTAFQYY